MHRASKPLPQQGRRPFRLATIAGCSGFVTIALVLYFVSVFSSSLNFQRFSTDVGLSQSPQIGSVQDGSFIMHPKDHVFRRPKTLKMTWKVTRQIQIPDGVEKPVYLINDEFPGPTIEARPGDSLEITVFNHVQNDTEGIAIHWHGLLMPGANLMDGAVGVTQCAIPQGQNLTYRFTLDDNQHGTYWYHAHSHVQRADGLYGGFIIHKPVEERGASSDASIYKYDHEKLLLIGDWYHRPGSAVLDWYRNPDHYGYEPAPDSMVINGRGSYNCSKAVTARPINCTVTQAPSLQLPNVNRARLRVVNTGASAGYSIVMKRGEMQLITVDGGAKVAENTPTTNAMGILYPGERIDVILDRTASMEDGSENSNEMSIELDRENMPLKNFALTRVQSFPVGESEQKGKGQHPAQQRRDSDSLPLYLAEVQGPVLEQDTPSFKTPSELAVLYTTVQIRSSNHNQPVGIFNHSSWILNDTQLKPLLALDESDWEKVTNQPSAVQKLSVPSFTMGDAEEKWMELVVNNMDDKGHPFHMHGHVFHVVLSRQAELGEYGAYNPFDAKSQHPAYPTVPFAPLVKDTVYVPAMGYVVLRFPLNNRGLWLMHCHVLWHQAVGMGMVFKIGDIDFAAKEAANQFCTK